MIFSNLKGRVLFETASFLLVFAVLFSSTSATVFASATPQWASGLLPSSAPQEFEPNCYLHICVRSSPGAMVWSGGVAGCPSTHS